MVTPFDDAVGLAVRIHAETLYELTAGKPGEASTVHLVAAMRAALLAVCNDSRFKNGLRSPTV